MPDAQNDTDQQTEPLSSDVLAFCNLIARIMMRCLRERDPRLREMLSLPPVSEGETHVTPSRSEHN